MSTLRHDDHGPVSSARRGFLQAGGALVVTFTLDAPAWAAAAAPQAAGGTAKSVALDSVAGFLAIDPSGMVTVYSGKVDLGTGVRTAMMQIAAEELDVPPERVQVVQGDTLLTPDQGPTYGSASVQVGGMQIRQAAATARAALRAEAARSLGLPIEQVVTQDGSVVSSDGKRVPYAELVTGRSLEIKVDPKAPLKDPKDYRLVGKSVPRLDIPAKVTGEFTYMQDFRVPGMLHARVIRPNAIEARLVSFDDAKARKTAGFVRTVRKGDFLAVVARDEWAAIKAARAVEARWGEGKRLPSKAALWDHVRGTKVVKQEVLQSVGDLGEGARSAARTLSSTFDFAIHTHGSIGPSASVAEYAAGKLTVWTASQQTHLLRKQLANMMQMKDDDIRCIYLEGSGCYGRNGHEDASADAALLARELGKPVRVQWMRHDEHGWDPKGPPTLLEYQGGVDANGNIVAWESQVWIPNRPGQVAVGLVAAELAGLPSEAAHPGNIHQGLAIPYALPNVRATAHSLAETPFRPSWIRTPGRMQNTFGNEVFFDELAFAAGADPLEFRIRNLKDARGIELLERLRQVAGWQPQPPRAAIEGDIARGRGVAYTKYELVRTYVGAVADVDVNLKTGQIVCKQFVVAHDCGQVINPDGLRNQIDGNVIQTVSRTLIEDLQWNEQGTVTSLDWASYPILRFPEVPKVVSELIDRPNEKPWGAGEPAAAVVPAAISNAVFNAVGARLRSVPFAPDKVLAALKQA